MSKKSTNNNAGIVIGGIVIGGFFCHRKISITVVIVDFMMEATSYVVSNEGFEGGVCQTHIVGRRGRLKNVVSKVAHNN